MFDHIFPSNPVLAYRYTHSASGPDAEELQQHHTASSPLPPHNLPRDSRYLAKFARGK